MRDEIKTHLSRNGNPRPSEVGEVWSAHFHSWNIVKHDQLGIDNQVSDRGADQDGGRGDSVNRDQAL